MQEQWGKEIKQERMFQIPQNVLYVQCKRTAEYTAKASLIYCSHVDKLFDITNNTVDTGSLAVGYC